MKVYLDGLKVVEFKSGRRVQFSVTFALDDGEPVATVRGWTMDRTRVIYPPASKTTFGKYYAIVDPSEWLMDKLQAKLKVMPEIIEVLGPVVDGVDFNGNARIIEGKVEL